MNCICNIQSVYNYIIKWEMGIKTHAQVFSQWLCNGKCNISNLNDLL